MVNNGEDDDGGGGVECYMNSLHIISHMSEFQ